MTVRLRFNRKGFDELLKSDEVLADLKRRAEAIARAAGPGHGVRSEVGRNRARAAVVTETYDAMRAEAEDRALTRAIDAGRR